MHEIAIDRKDGLRIFVEKDSHPLTAWLNNKRVNGSRMDVFLAIGVVRGLQVARNYAAKYGEPEELREIDARMLSLAKELEAADKAKEIG